MRWRRSGTICQGEDKRDCAKVTQHKSPGWSGPELQVNAGGSESKGCRTLTSPPEGPPLSIPEGSQGLVHRKPLKIPLLLKDSAAMTVVEIKAMEESGHLLQDGKELDAELPPPRLYCFLFMLAWLRGTASATASPCSAPHRRSPEAMPSSVLVGRLLPTGLSQAAPPLNSVGVSLGETPPVKSHLELILHSPIQGFSERFLPYSKAFLTPNHVCVSTCQLPSLPYTLEMVVGKVSSALSHMASELWREFLPKWEEAGANSADTFLYLLLLPIGIRQTGVQIQALSCKLKFN